MITALARDMYTSAMYSTRVNQTCDPLHVPMHSRSVFAAFIVGNAPVYYLLPSNLVARVMTCLSWAKKPTCIDVTFVPIVVKFPREELLYVVPLCVCYVAGCLAVCQSCSPLCCKYL